MTPHVVDRNPRLRNGRLLSIAALGFVAPNLLMAGLLAPPARIVLILATLAAAAFLWLQAPAAGAWSRQGVQGRPLALCLALGLLLAILGGEGHLVFANSDWFWRDAVLADLARGPGLPQYRVAGALWILRTPLGMYLLPAMVGRAVGLWAAHAALAFQNGALLGTMLYVFQGLFPRRRALGLLAMLAYSGLSLIGTLLIRSERGRPLDPSQFSSHLDNWSPYWQYSSQLTQLFWVPNHALPGWWVALMVLLAEQEDLSLAWMGLATAALAIWSPFPVLGAAPFLTYRFLRRPLVEVADRRLWLALAIAFLFLPVAAYMLLGAAAVSGGLQAQRPLFAIFFMQFTLVMLLPATPALGEAFEHQRRDRMILLIALLVLLLLPFVRAGPYNELGMRASIPALTITAFGFGRLIAVGWSGARRRWLIACVLGIIAVAGPSAELERIMIFPRWGFSRCDFATAQSQLDVSPISPNYMAPAKLAPKWLLGAGVRPPTDLSSAPCWPDFPFYPRMWVWGFSNQRLLAAVAARRRGEVQAIPGERGDPSHSAARP